MHVYEKYHLLNAIWNNGKLLNFYMIFTIQKYMVNHQELADEYEYDW